LLNFNNGENTTITAKQVHPMPKTPGTYTTSDLSRRSGDIIAEALRHPVTITQRNKPRLILLNIEDFERLRSRADQHSVGTIETMPASLLSEIEDAVVNYAKSNEASRP
jgi:prevent-host-death family protein